MDEAKNTEQDRATRRKPYRAPAVAAIRLTAMVASGSGVDEDSGGLLTKPGKGAAPPGSP
jgi:hypothetical protein